MSGPADEPSAAVAPRRRHDVPDRLDPRSRVQRVLMAAAADRARDPHAEARSAEEIAADLRIDVELATSLLQEGLALVGLWVYGADAVAGATGPVLDPDEAVEYLVSRRMVDLEPDERTPRSLGSPRSLERAPARADESSSLAMRNAAMAAITYEDHATPASQERPLAPHTVRVPRRRDRPSRPPAAPDEPPGPSEETVRRAAPRGPADEAPALPRPPGRVRSAQGNLVLLAVSASALAGAVVLGATLVQIGLPLVVVVALAFGFAVLDGVLHWTIVAARPVRTPWAAVAGAVVAGLVVSAFAGELLLLTVFEDEIDTVVIGEQRGAIESDTERDVEAAFAAADADDLSQLDAVTASLLDDYERLTVAAEEARSRCNAEVDGTGGSGQAGQGPVADQLCGEAEQAEARAAAAQAELQQATQDRSEVEAEASESLAQEVDEIRSAGTARLDELQEPTLGQRLDVLPTVAPSWLRLAFVATFVSIILLPLVLRTAGSGGPGGAGTDRDRGPT